MVKIFSNFVKKKPSFRIISDVDTISIYAVQMTSSEIVCTSYAVRSANGSNLGHSFHMIQHADQTYRFRQHSPLYTFYGRFHSLGAFLFFDIIKIISSHILHTKYSSIKMLAAFGQRYFVPLVLHFATQSEAILTTVYVRADFVIGGANVQQLNYSNFKQANKLSTNEIINQLFIHCIRQNSSTLYVSCQIL